MICVPLEEMVDHLDGATSPQRAAEIEAHLPGCQSCAALRLELLALTSNVAPQPDEAQGIPGLSDDVLTLVRLGRTQSRLPATPRLLGVPRRWALPLGGAGLALAAAAVLLFLRTPGVTADDDGFRARSVVASEDQWVDLHLFRASDGGDGHEAVAGSIDVDDRLAVSITNLTRSELSHLAVFSVDAAGHIFWYYPAYTVPGSDPVSIPVCTRCRDQLLPDEVRHALQPGPLRLFALFTKTPRTVSELEQHIARDLATAGGVLALERLELVGAAQRSLLLTVTATPSGDR